MEQSPPFLSPREKAKEIANYQNSGSLTKSLIVSSSTDIIAHTPPVQVTRRVSNDENILIPSSSFDDNHNDISSSVAPSSASLSRKKNFHRENKKKLKELQNTIHCSKIKQQKNQELLKLKKSRQKQRKFQHVSSRVFAGAGAGAGTTGSRSSNRSSPSSTTSSLSSSSFTTVQKSDDKVIQNQPSYNSPSTQKEESDLESQFSSSCQVSTTIRRHSSRDHSTPKQLQRRYSSKSIVDTYNEIRTPTTTTSGSLSSTKKKNDEYSQNQSKSVFHKDFGKVPSYLRKQQKLIQKQKQLLEPLCSQEDTATKATDMTNAEQTQQTTTTMVRVKDADVKQTLKLLKENLVNTRKEVFKLPMMNGNNSACSGIIQKRTRLEKEIKDIEDCITLYSRDKVYIARKDCV